MSGPPASILFATILGLLAPAAPVSLCVFPLTEYKIQRALVAREGVPVWIVAATVTDPKRDKPLYCGFFATPDERQRHIVRAFLWNGDLLPLTYHDDFHACPSYLVARTRLWGW